MEQLLTTLGSWLEALPDGSTSTDVLRFVFPLLAIAIVAELVDVRYKQRYSDEARNRHEKSLGRE